eukprot:TRINITY_DN11417_c0_g3_i1.p2 TRINITY_DN11417_c0_g3~~TRINITY_DN11417_c0_g3_i1.p2  ORF type:complete len:229 (+),score=23.92 TRINITY_DN11417_c0_g3_i1:428-1114(+)
MLTPLLLVFAVLFNSHIRTSETQHPVFGALEVRLSKASTWRLVCDNGFSTTDAIVACRMMDYSGRSTVSEFRTRVWAGTFRCAMDRVSCSSGQTSLYDCSSRQIVQCDFEEGVSFKCNGPRAAPDGEARFNPTCGTLEVRRSEAQPWLPVCDDRFKVAEANVACAMMGGGNAYQSWRQAKDSLPWERLRCDGTQTSLNDYQYSGETYFCGRLHGIRFTCDGLDAASEQ